MKLTRRPHGTADGDHRLEAAGTHGPRRWFAADVACWKAATHLLASAP